MSTRLNARIYLAIGLVICLSMACSLPVVTQSGSSGQPTYTNDGADPNLAQTLAVQTIAAMETEVAGSSTINTPEPEKPSTAEPTATLTLRPSSTPYPTPTTVKLPDFSPTPVCDQAGFVKDINIPDGSEIGPGASFDKTWRLKNTGSCTWTTEYAIVFDSGDQMSGPSEQVLTAAVLPGETVDITVRLKAPSSSGTYKGNWKLRNANKVLFGLGANRTGKFYVEIKVAGVATPISGKGFDLAASYCTATWSGNDASLPCNGTSGDTKGFVLYQSTPTLETGYIDDEPALLTNPPAANNAYIRGKFPAYTVKAGDIFSATIGCEYNAKNCNVRFMLEYSVDNGSIQTLNSWDQSYDNSFANISVDLSSLAGKNVNFILTVYANGESNQDRAQWLAPKITSK